MTYNFEIESYGINVSYKENNYLLRRFALLIAKWIEDAGESAEVLKGFVIRPEINEDVHNGDFEITVMGKTLSLCVGTYHGFEGFLSYLDDVLSSGKNCFYDGYCYKGNYKDKLNELTKSGAYVYEKGLYTRVMSYNVLWGHPDVGQRNKLQAEIIKQYNPDVLGLQECADNNRVYAGDNNIITLLAALGYKETTDAKISGTYRRRNVSPILYNTNTTNLMGSESYIFRNQQISGETRILTWAVLNTAGKRYVVINFQLEGGNIVVGLEQVKEIETLVNELGKSYKDTPVFIIGDYNFTATTASYAYIVNSAGYINIRNLAKEHCSIAKSYHPYPKYDSELDLMLPNGSAESDPHADNSFDHIFLAKGEADIRLYGIAIDECTLSASDHFPVFTDFKI